MQGIYYLLGLAVFCVIVCWFIQNDGVAPGEPTKGLLRMKDDGTSTESGKDDSRSKSVDARQRD